MDAPDLDQRKTSVLIVGGGPVGLVLAADLGRRGVDCILIERTDGSIPQPKMLTVGARTMEYCRRWGIAGRVHAEAISPDFPRNTLYVTAMAGHEIARFDHGGATGGKPAGPGWRYGPEPRERCAQTWFDPILRDYAASCPAVTLAYRQRLETFTQSGDGVVATVIDEDTGKAAQVSAEYIVGCDGAGSTVRKVAGIEPVGVRDSSRSLATFFECDALWTHHDKGKSLMTHICDADGPWGMLTTIDGVRIWRLSTERLPEDFDIDTYDAAASVRRAIGVDFPFEVTGVVLWTRRHMVVDHYRMGRAFLAGDSAHQLTNVGGFGMNTGIGDAVDLAWKLEAAVKGWAGPGLLDSYEAERKPIAARVVFEAASNQDDTRGMPTGPDIDKDGPAGEAARQRARDYIDEHQLNRIHINPGIELGYRYEGSPVICPDGTPEPPVEIVTYTQTSRPGHRAPHAWLADNKSTLDLFGDGFVLLAFGGADGSAFAEAARKRGVPLTVVPVDDADVATLYERRLVLVRPDGHAAWRGDEAPGDALAVIDRVRGAAAEGVAVKAAE